LHGVKPPEPAVKADAAPVKSDPSATSHTPNDPGQAAPAKPN